MISQTNKIKQSTKHALVENDLDELSKKVEAISIKGLTKDLVNELKVLNGTKYFFFKNISKLFSIYTS